MTTTPARDPGELLYEAARRAAELGWRTITVARLRKLAQGDASALPPGPATAPPSAFGTYRPRPTAAAARPDATGGA